MTGDCHVRFCKRLGVKLPRPTNLGAATLRGGSSGGPSLVAVARRDQASGVNASRVA
jgi:hypothetical protein